jgi:hypothetical protein
VKVRPVVLSLAILNVLVVASCMPQAMPAAGGLPHTDAIQIAPPPSVGAQSNGSSHQLATIETTGTVIKDNPSEYIDFGSRRLVNNAWGAPSDEFLNSAVYLKADRCFGSDWKRPDPKGRSALSQIQPIYPSVRVGGSPWQASSTRQFPIKLDDIKSLQFDLAYSYPVKPTGSYDLAYDMFLLDTDKPSSSPCLKAEVMIWLHGTQNEPIHAYKGDFDDGYNKYALYSWQMDDGRLYYAFLMKGEPQMAANHTVDVKKLLGYLPLDSSWYVHGIELGNEVWSGSGNIEISRLSVRMNGQEL